MFLTNVCFKSALKSLSLASFGRPWAAFGRSWPLWGRFWALLGRSWAAFGRSWPLLGRSWNDMQKSSKIQCKKYQKNPDLDPQKPPKSLPK